MKVGLVVDAGGVPLAAATDAANVDEGYMAGAVLAGVTVAVPGGVPVLADRAYDSDPLRAWLWDCGFRLLSPHRKDRKRPPTNDGRRMRRYRRRYVVERTFAWLQSFRRVATRYERDVNLYDGFVALACAFIAVGKL
jgi:transposase